MGGGGLLRPWDPVSEESFSSLRTLTMRTNEPWTSPRDGVAMVQDHGCQRNSCGSVRREEEGTGISSDVVKVKGEDPVTPGPLSE